MRTLYRALRTLANRLVGILQGCLRTHTLDNEHLALAQRTRQTQPCSLTASRRGMSSQPRLQLLGAAMDGRTCLRTTGSHRSSKYTP